MVVALVLALSIPVSQLRTARVTHACCCPDPTSCHCPDHDDTKPDQPQLKACHQTTTISVAPTLPVFSPPVPTALPAPVTALVVALHVSHAPHAAPAPARPDAPS